MIRRMFFPGLLDTGHICSKIMAIRDCFVNLYIIRAPEGLICVDAGWRRSHVRQAFQSLGLKIDQVHTVLITHAHLDHAWCLDLFPQAAVYMGEREISSALLRKRKLPPLIDVHEGHELFCAGMNIRIIETPGHTTGSVAYLVDRRFLFTGDALRLRQGEVLPFYGCFSKDKPALKQSVQKLARIDGVERLLTAHSGTTGDIPRAFQNWTEAIPEQTE